jgi:hypothetical protein
MLEIAYLNFKKSKIFWLHWRAALGARLGAAHGARLVCLRIPVSLKKEALREINDKFDDSHTEFEQ